MADQPRQGLFSSLTLGRSSKTPKGPAEPTLAHPLLGASTSSLNINDASSNLNDTSHRPSGHGRQGSASSITNRNVSTSDVLNVPYKPRQRGSHTHGSANSVSSVNSITTGTSVSPLIIPTAGTSPVTATSSIAAAPTTSTSTSTTFALPPSAVAAETTSVETMTSSPTMGGSSSATSRLQLQSLKAAAQKIGLGNGSMGMGMIDTIYEKGQAGRGKADSSEWSDVLRLIAGGKAVLLLPTTTASSLPITPQIVRDHVAFLSPNLPSPTDTKEYTISSQSEGSASAMIVTLSGIVGTLRGSTLAFETTLPADSSILAAIRDPITRTATLSALRPIIPASSASHFPSSTLSAESTNLPFPPLNKSSTSNSVADIKETKVPAGKLARINPFASLFGAASTPSPAAGSPPTSASATAGAGISTPERSRSPVNPISPPRSIISPKPSMLALDAETASIRSDITSRDLEGYQVTAYTVSKAVRHGDISKSIHKALRTNVREELHRLPEKVVDKVFKLVVAGACPTYFVSADAKADVAASQIDYADPTAAGEKLQEFIEGIYDDLILHFRADSSHLFAENSEFSSMRRKASWSRKGIPPEMGGEADSEDAKKERKEKLRRERETIVERDASEGTERVEAVVCRILYNRLFSPIESDDARHDEALSSRIAALNMLDLSLDHLGLITRPDDEPKGEEGTVARGLNAIVDRIGDELQKLSTSNCLTPKEKGDVLIQAHKLVVDGLTNLPPIDLRPEGEPYNPPAADENASSDKLPTSLAIPTVSSDSSLTDSVTSPEIAAESKPIPRQRRKSSSSGSTPLSTSPASSDPLTTISEVIEKTPQALQESSASDVPQLVLTESSRDEEADASEIEEAMSDSVMTLQARPSRASSPSLSEERAKPKTSTSGADLILPIIIFAVVKSNPPQLASQLMYLRRYRSAICLTGEASYAIVNLTAVVEFLEHVELSQLGLGDESGKVISVEDLSPIGLNYLDESNADAASIASASSRLRGRVFQVGELAGSAADSANKVLTGVVDSSWTALRGLIVSPNPGNVGETDNTESVALAGESRPGMRPRQASTFSLASVTASVATIAAAAANRSRSRANSRASNLVNPSKEEHVWKGNEEMVEVPSRAASIREKDKDRLVQGDVSDSSDQSGSEDEGRMAMGLGKKSRERRRSDTRSIMSVSSALSRVKSRDTQNGDKDKKEREDEGRDRVSIGDRLASIGGVRGILSNQPESEPSQVKTVGFISGMTSKGAAVSGHARRLSLLGGSRNAESSPAGSTTSLPSMHAQALAGEVEPPIEQFMTCEVGDIKLSEIGILLRDYRRLAGIVNSLKSASTPPL